MGPLRYPALAAVTPVNAWWAYGGILGFFLALVTVGALWSTVRVGLASLRERRRPNPIERRGTSPNHGEAVEIGGQQYVKTRGVWRLLIGERGSTRFVRLSQREAEYVEWRARTLARPGDEEPGV